MILIWKNRELQDISRIEINFENIFLGRAFFETLLWDSQAGFVLWEKHIERISQALDRSQVYSFDDLKEKLFIYIKHRFSELQNLRVKLIIDFYEQNLPAKHSRKIFTVRKLPQLFQNFMFLGNFVYYRFSNQR